MRSLSATARKQVTEILGLHLCFGFERFLCCAYRLSRDKCSFRLRLSSLLWLVCRHIYVKFMLNRSFIFYEHFPPVKPCQFIFFAHRNRVSWAYLCALSAEDAAVHVMIYFCFHAFAYHFYRARRTNGLAQTASYALVHVPNRATSEPFGHCLAFIGILERRWFFEELSQRFLNQTQSDNPPNPS